MARPWYGRLYRDWVGRRVITTRKMQRKDGLVIQSGVYVDITSTYRGRFSLRTIGKMNVEIHRVSPWGTLRRLADDRTPRSTP